ncbi:tetratricopeptide repeat protein [Bacillus marinisedimentorum]|uniref:tetratricopeptide repeat protein n=1 Tax=Bacillus marinisedimentorum TaxID=1821260 RepID=UPI0007E064F2|nr:tetratricopeptide repeat protein [Bacillus marinisedimentorum]
MGTSRKWIISLLGLSFVIVIALISLNIFARENPSSKKSESMEEKISRLEKYTKDNEEDAEARLRLALYYYHNNEYDKSVSENKKALKLKPNDPLAWQRLGNTYASQGKFEDAKQAREQVVKYQKEPAGWSYLSLSTLTVLDDPAAALEQSQKALEIAKGFKGARLGLYKSWVSTLKTYVELTDKNQVGAAYVNLVTNNLYLEKSLVLKYIDEALASGELNEEQKNRVLDVQEKVRDFEFDNVSVTEILDGEQ